MTTNQIHVIDGPNQEFAGRLFDARNRAGLTQEDLADAVGINKRNISLYENGHARPRGETIRKLADALKCDADHLATGSNAATQQFLATQYRERMPIIPTITSLYIEEWATLPPSDPRPRLPDYYVRPSCGLPADVFVHWVERVQGFFRAVRYPGMTPDSPEYPAGSVLIFDSGPVNEHTMENGDLVIFRTGGVENAPSLRRFVRDPEPGMCQPMLLSLNPALPAITFDRHDIELIGVVIEQVITRKPLLLGPAPTADSA